jgi:hypothetical protein
MAALIGLAIVGVIVTAGYIALVCFIGAFLKFTWDENDDDDQNGYT